MERTIGTVVRGVRAPIIREGDDLAQIVTESVLNCIAAENITIGHKDVIGITESILARAQGNYASVGDIAEDIKAQLVSNSDFKFILDMRKAAIAKAGDVQYADDLMKKIMLANNRDKGMEYVEEHYAASIQELTWSLLKNKIAMAFDIKVEDKDVEQAAREMVKIQFAQYGMANVPEEFLDNYVQETLKKHENIDNLVERALDTKLCAKVKETVKLEEKTVSIDEFNKLMEEM